jgi:DNA-binding transcriptional ArsR family regulator
MTAQPDETDNLWAALADPMRIRLIDLLLERGEATASALASALPITRQGVSKHLAVLERDRFVTSHKRGREVLYSLRGERLDEARAALARTATRWDTRLKTIKKLAKQTAKRDGP